MTEDTSPYTDPLAAYDQLVMEGRAPSPQAFAAAHPDHPSLLDRIKELESLRQDLGRLVARAAPRAAAAPPEVPGFELIRPLGSGGMGRVFLARQQHPRRLCALKVTGAANARAIDRFRREADLAAGLQHPGIATVYGAGLALGLPYLATEYIHGFSLRSLLQVSDLVAPDDPGGWLTDAVRGVSEGLPASTQAEAQAPVRTVLGLGLQISEALAHAHERGVVHRDIKPSNILVTLDGKAKVIDFGIAVRAGVDNERLTQTGDFVGSYGYAAPEQLRGEPHRIGPWTDVYALGATLFEMLTQQPPFQVANFADRLLLVDSSPAHRPRHFNPQVPHALDVLVMRALHPNIDQRFADGQELNEALAACPTGRSLLPRFIPSHRFAGWPRLPWTRIHWLAALATALALGFASLYSYESGLLLQERRAMAWERRQSASAVLDWLLQAERNALEQCIVDEERPPVMLFVRPRWVAEVVISRGVVLSVTVLPQSAALGNSVKQCMGRVVEKLEVPGVGIDRPQTLRVEFNVDLPRTP